MNSNGKISEILMKWDPIGIGDEPTAQDEYNSYAEELETRSSQFENAEQVKEYLRNIEIHMGIPTTNEEELNEIAINIFVILSDL